MSPVYTINERLPYRYQVAFLNNSFRYDAIGRSGVPKCLEWNEVIRYLIRPDELGNRTVADQLP